MVIAVDANVILSALLGGKPSYILFDPRFQFITAEFTLDEVHKYLPRLAKKLVVPISTLETALHLLPIQSFAKRTYYSHLVIAQNMIDHIDNKDSDILALALRFDCYLWSQDKDFERAQYHKLLKTYQFL